MKYYIKISPGNVYVKIPERKGINPLSHFCQEIGCDVIEIVHLGAGYVLAIDEAGRLKDEPKLNRMASALYGGVLVGTVLLMKEVPDGEGCYDLEPLSEKEASVMINKLMFLSSFV